MTTFDFNDAIPAAGNDPSVDQPDMLTNNVSTKALIAVDHITFGAANGGLHKQINFNANNIPGAVPLDPLSFIFTKNNGAGHPYPFFLNSQAAAVANALPFLPDLVSAGNNYGFQIGTIIINFGKAAVPGAVVFAITFPNNVLAITTGTNNASANVSSTVSGLGLGGATLNSTAINAVWYIAIGN